MQCHECGATVAANLAICPICGARRASAPAVPPARHAAASPLAKSQAGNGLPRVGDVFAERYRVEKYLGVGSLCNAYLCRDAGAGNREVVLKIMHARKAAEAGMADSFLFLASSVAKYDHKGIARIFDTGRHAGQPYYAMEWVGGTPMRMWLLERLNFENRVLPGLGIIASLLDTFEAVHERGCYGCLKPENVFITLNGPVIMDFGTVGFLSPQEFEYNTYARRYLPYMAPELRQDWANLLPQSDFYSLGALLYEVLTGRAPAPQLRLPSELSRAFGIDADEIILKAMAARPMDRFATVEAFRQAVVSLQASLMASRSEEAGADGILPAAASPVAHPSLEITSDPVSVNNPDEAFEDPDTGTFRTPGTGTMPVDAGEAWMREGNGPAAEGDAEGRTLSAFAALGDRGLEAAHAQRRFAQGTAPLAMNPVPDGQAAFGEAAGDPAAMAESGGAKEAFPGANAAPVPAWLWVFLALAGSCLVVGAAYLGLQLH